jgi:hypothetical protein
MRAANEMTSARSTSRSDARIVGVDPARPSCRCCGIDAPQLRHQRTHAVEVSRCWRGLAIHDQQHRRAATAGPRCAGLQRIDDVGDVGTAARGAPSLYATISG